MQGVSCGVACNSDKMKSLPQRHESEQEVATNSLDGTQHSTEDG